MPSEKLLSYSLISRILWILVYLCVAYLYEEQTVFFFFPNNKMEREKPVEHCGNEPCVSLGLYLK